jgi:hypothetical protein
MSSCSKEHAYDQLMHGQIAVIQEVNKSELNSERGQVMFVLNLYHVPKDHASTHIRAHFTPLFSPFDLDSWL